MVDGEVDVFLTYAHRHVSLRLEDGQFEFLTVASDQAIPVVAPELVVDDIRHDGRSVLASAIAGELTLPYASYGGESFFGLALRRLFDLSPSFRRTTVHENSIAHGLKAICMSGGGVCWLPRSLVAAELASGALVQASTDPRWILDLDIRLYRAAEGGKSAVAASLWDRARRLATR
ncbi:substrate-binding domain-containing protein [Acetobacter nitrogenifigens]|uniref:substrate-binding domain-containing protein n=1 Tax=Acetobacter nitrogenifigens TaxID=285268 RepID=UPI0022320BD5|nr:substrate-binding domain-containing protein [Acetobacter nitrogenifigens]